MTEGVAWLFAERFRDTIPAMDERTVTSTRDSYEGVERWSLFDVGLRLRVNGALLPALRTIGDRVLADYRREVPTMGPEEWRQAQAAFAWARVLAPRDNSLLSKQLTADGHVRRLAAQRSKPANTATAQTAVARFRDARARRIPRRSTRTWGWPSRSCTCSATPTAQSTRSTRPSSAATP
jgi:hypothetical protein